MIQYEKENNISFEDIALEKEIFKKTTDYEYSINNLPINGLDSLSLFSLMVTVIEYFITSIFCSTAMPTMTFLILNVLMSGLFFVGFLITTMLISTLFLVLFRIDLISYFSDRFQIKLINRKIIAKNEIIPDIKQNKHDYYNYITQKNVRLCLINEIDNSLLMAKRYKLDNETIEELEQVKNKYIKFNLSREPENEFCVLNNHIINKLQAINSSIKELSENNFYTEYIKVESDKLVTKSKLLDNVIKYKEIL